MKPRNTTIVAWAICIPLVALEIFGLVKSKKLDPQSLVITLVVFFLVFVICFFLLQRRGGEKVEKDERTIRIANRALSYSWVLSIITVMVLMYLEYIEVLRISAVQALTIVAMIMSFSSLALRAILNRKGDID